MNCRKITSALLSFVAVPFALFPLEEPRRRTACRSRLFRCGRRRAPDEVGSAPSWHETTAGGKVGFYGDNT